MMTAFFLLYFVEYPMYPGRGSWKLVNNDNMLSCILIIDHDVEKERYNDLTFISDSEFDMHSHLI